MGITLYSLFTLLKLVNKPKTQVVIVIIDNFFKLSNIYFNGFFLFKNLDFFKTNVGIIKIIFFFLFDNFFIIDKLFNNKKLIYVKFKKNTSNL